LAFQDPKPNTEIYKKRIFVQNHKFRLSKQIDIITDRRIKDLHI